MLWTHQVEITPVTHREESCHRELEYMELCICILVGNVYKNQKKWFVMYFAYLLSLRSSTRLSQFLKAASFLMKNIYSSFRAILFCFEMLTKELKIRSILIINLNIYLENIFKIGKMNGQIWITLRFCKTKIGKIIHCKVRLISSKPNKLSKKGSWVEILN